MKELLKRAIVLSENGKFDEALALFETARIKAPRSASVLNDRAQALRLAGRSEGAFKMTSIRLFTFFFYVLTKVCMNFLSFNSALV